MNKKMIRFARGAKCGIRGSKGLAEASDCPSNPASANEPNPHAAFRNKSRRLSEFP
jgi:hypothetical protein